MFHKILTSKIERIGIISLNYPKNMNILSFEMLKEIHQALKIFEADNEVKIILLKAEPAFSKNGRKIFSAGVDLKKYDEKFKLVEENPEKFKEILEKSRKFISKIEKLKKPVIAGVDGLAVGGAFEMILACDLILASEEASFALSEVNIGLIPGYGGIRRLLELIGKKKTFEIIASGKTIFADEAVNLGITAGIYPVSDFQEKILEYCKNLSEKSSNSMRLIKDTINKLSNFSDKVEIENFMEAVSSNDAREGVAAFLEKREPRF